MSFIKGLLFEEDESAKKDKKPEPQTPFSFKSQGNVVFPSSSPTTVPASFLSPSTPGSDADPRMVAEVEQMLGAQSSPAYTQFGTLLASMSFIPDEAMRYKAAVQAAQTTMNLSPSAIIDAYASRLTALDAIESQFQNQSQAELKRRTSQSEAEITRLNSEIDRRKAEVMRLTTEIAQFEAQRSEREKTIEQDTKEINDVAQRMTTAIATVRNKATTERDTVSRNITTGGNQ